MKYLKKYFFLLTIILIVFSCKDENISPDDVNNEFSKISIKKDQNEFDVLSLKMSRGEHVSDLFSLNKVYKEGNFLMVEVSYGGGCKEHSFQIIWPEVIVMIYPPQYPVVLIHDGKEDGCYAYITETLKFDLSNSDLDFNEETIKAMEIIVQNGSIKDEEISTKK